MLTKAGWLGIAALVSVMSACEGPLRCAEKSAVAMWGICACPVGTRYNEGMDRCILEDSTTSQVGVDGGAPANAAVDADSHIGASNAECDVAEAGCPEPTLDGQTREPGNSDADTAEADGEARNPDGDTSEYANVVATQIAAGEGHTCAVLSNRTVACWGYNAFGQLGDGSQEHRTTPVLVQNLHDISQVALGGRHSCALAEDGTISCWGNYQSICGLEHETVVCPAGRAVSSTPVEVAQLPDAVEISAGSAHTCARHSTSSVSCWGDNTFGQLGNIALAK